MRVLVTIDSSELSQAALKAIAPWARASDAEVVLLTVQQPARVHETVSRPISHSLTPLGTASGQPLDVGEPFLTAAEDRTQALERTRIELESQLRRDAEQLLPGVRTEAHIAWASDIPRAIAEKATEFKVDFIAMSTHGRKGVSHALMGSVAEAVLRASPVPVLLVREGMSVPAGA